MLKKKILFHSNWSKSKTGFGRNAKAVLKYLHSTGKYEIMEYASGRTWSDPELQNMPWKARGTLPDSQQEMNAQLAGLSEHNKMVKQRAINYGELNIDRVIREFKPDVIFMAEDIWAFKSYFDKPWWNKITCVVHATLDSLPILPEAVEAAKKIKNYYVWANFAEKEMRRLGHGHVKTLHGAIETDRFYRLEDGRRLELRKKHRLPPNAFITGFVFRNQLRKSVVPLLQGFKTFLERNPESNAFLLLHTCWSETDRGWNIPARIKEIGLDPNRVLATYICANCNEYEIKPFQIPPEEWQKYNIDTKTGEGKDCRFCGAKKSQKTINPVRGVSEEQLNEIYNLMDNYIHPVTSGGQEIPVQEAKLTELVTAVTSYSCGEDWSTEESGGLPLDWEEYREPGSEFIKAATKSDSITCQMERVYKMTSDKRSDWGQKARKYALEKTGIDSIGPKIQKIVDAAPYVIEDGE